MVKDRYKKGSNIYSRDIRKFSIYPKMPKPKDSETRKRPRVGQKIKVVIDDVDEKERGVGKYKGYTVLVLGNPTVGETIYAKIVSVRGDTILAEPISYEDREIEPY
ncbi:MAG: hypothetical protein F7C32_00850 [Desulfurococcales archaeon]|nr:hypothetical protein [Desulfurococcales archaeon]